MSLMKHIVVENLPFSYAESPTLRDIFTLLNPNCSKMTIGADVIADNVLRRYLQEKIKIRKYFNKVESQISLTLDVWTSPNRFSVLGITCHWIDGNWQLRELVLDASELKGPHSGANMAQHVLEILNEFNISEKIFCVTGDNAAANKVLGEKLGLSLKNFDGKNNMLGCVGHVINLAAQAGIRTLALSNQSKEKDINNVSSPTEDMEYQV